MLGADDPPTGLHCSLRVLTDGMLPRLSSTALLFQLQLSLRLSLLLPILTRPTRRTHELPPLLLGLPIALFELLGLSHHHTEGLPLVVNAVIYSEPGIPLTLFSPLTCPPDTDDDTKQAEQAEDGTQEGHQVIH